MPGRPPIIAAVIGRDGFALDTGEQSETPPVLWDDPVFLLDALGATCALDATIIWDVDKWPDDEAVPKKLQKSGWEFKEFRTDWTTFHRLRNGALQRITIGLLPHISGHMLFDAKTDPWPVIVDRIAKYRRVSGVALSGRPGINGVQLLRNKFQDKRPGRQPRWFLDKGPGSPEWRGGKMWPAGDLQFKREPNAVELRCDLDVHRFDINAQYLAAAGNALYAWNGLEHSTTELYDGKRAGYWLINFEAMSDCWPSALPPIIGTRRRRDDGTVWLTTPMMGLLDERGCHPDIIESWTAPGRRFLAPWAEHYRNARMGMVGDITDPHVAAAIKATPNEAIGLFNRRKGRLYRPDWQHTTIDTARANALRKLVAVFESCGEIPLCVNFDSVWYADGDAVDSLERAGAVHFQQIGKFRYEYTTPLAARDWEGKK